MAQDGVRELWRKRKIEVLLTRERDRQTDTQTDRLTDRQRNRQTDRQAGRRAKTFVRSIE